MPDSPPAVLLAEDNDVNARLIVAVLERAGYAVTVAPDGARAVAAVERASFGLVLMDVNMPVMDGLTAARAIRAGRRGDVPILALTADEDGGTRKACAAAGMDGYVTKPIDMGDLIRAVANGIAMGRRSA